MSDTRVMQPQMARLANPDSDILPVNELNGYELIAKVGQGGMGAVFKARQKSLDRIVALKILPPHIAHDGQFLERFQREARASAKLCHPNVVQGIDVGQDPRSKLWYFAMEFVDGPTLRKLIKQEQRLPEARALLIVREVARALVAINESGMIHRDIKPDNIILNTRGEVKVADLGLTRAMDDTSEMTQSGQAVGTPHYMSPEQVRGRTDLDIRVDLYALGATLFHMVTGTTPFKGGTGAEILSKHLTETVPSAHKICPEVSEGCSRLIAKLMEKKREARIQTPQELIERIDALLRTDTAVAAKRAEINGAFARLGPKLLAAAQRPPAPVALKPGQRIYVEGIDDIEPPVAAPRAQTAKQSVKGAHDNREERLIAIGAARKTKKSTPTVAWGLIAAGALVVVILGALLFSSSSNSDAANPKPEPKAIPIALTENVAKPSAPIARNAPAAPATPTRAEKAKSELDSALALDAAEFPAIFTALTRAATQAKDTPVATAVAQAQKAAEARWKTRFDAVLQGQTAKADSLLAKNDPTGALNALQDDAIAENLRTLDWQSQLETARTRVQAKTEAAAARILTESRALAADGTAKGLRSAIERAHDLDAFPADAAPSVATAREESAKWNAAADALDQKEKTGRATRREQSSGLADAVRKELTPALQQSHFSAALELLDRKLKDPAMADAKDSLLSDKSDIEAVIALRQRAVEALRASVGKAVTLKRGKSTLSGKLVPDAKGITLKLADGPEMTLTLDQLDAADIQTFAPPVTGAGQGEDLRRRALLLFYAGDDFAKAKELFSAAKEAGMGDAVDPYLERLKAREVGETEVRAQKDWAAAESLFTAKRWEEAQAAYTAFKINDATTAVYTQNAQELPKRFEAIDFALHPLSEGLIGTYYKGRDFKDSDKIMTRIDKEIDFRWTEKPPAEVPHDNYCVVWEGVLKVPKAGHYTLGLRVDDGGRLYIDGKEVVGDWKVHGVVHITADVELTEGSHELKLEYFQYDGGAECRLEWGMKGAFDAALIPASALWHDAKRKIAAKK